MLKKKLSIIIVAAVISNLSSSAMLTLANEVKEGTTVLSETQNDDESNTSGDAEVNKFNLLNDENLDSYNKVFKMDNSNIKSITNNGGKYFSSTIDKAIDNDFSTHWETGRHNREGFTNEVVITLNEPTVLNRVVYGTRRDSAKGKGFPKKLKIYASESESGDDFNLVCNGSYSGSIADIVEIKFKPTEFKRLKFVFVEAYRDWASASEFMLYKPDEARDKVDNLFTDKSYSDLKAEYKNTEYINNLEKKVEIHPLKDELVSKLSIAKEILNNNLDLENTLFKAEQFGDMARYGREVLNMASQGENFQVTGLYALPDEKLKVYVEVEDGKPMPRLIFSQNEGSFAHWRRTVNLHTGLNEITVPTVLRDGYYKTNPKSGGAIYIENPYTPEEQGKAPIIRIEGAHRFPLFKDGDNEENFKEFLVDYKKKLDEDNEAGTNKVLDLTEIDSKRMTLSGTATGAYDAYISKNIKPSETTAFWNDTMNELYKYYGFDGSSKENELKDIKEHMRLAQPFGAMYASGDHIGVQRSAMSGMLNPEVIKKGSWGFIHEIGHRMDTNGRTWGEVTNNMMPMYMGVKFGHLSHKLPCESDIYPNVAPNNRLEPYVNSHFFESLGLFWQLQIYDSSYWTNLNKLYRKNNPNPRSEQEKRDTLIEYSSEVLNLDLSEYFKRHGFEADKETLEKLSKYNKPSKKIWYLNNTCLGYNSGALDKTSKPVLDSEINENSFGELELKFSSGIPKEKLLGYEIQRNGEVIGFTGGTTFKDSTAKPNTEYEYKIIAYGKDLSTSGESSGVKREIQRAYISLDKLNWGVTSNLKVSSGNLGNIIDGRIDKWSVFEGKKPTADEIKNEGLAEGTPYVLIDMKENKDFDGFEYYNATSKSSGRGMVKTYNLYISDDGQNFTKVVDNKEIPNALERGRKKVILDKTYNARYIKFECVQDTRKDNLITAVDFATIKKVRDIELSKIDITSKVGKQKIYEINTIGEGVDFDANLYPDNATKREVNWTVVNATDNTSVDKYVTIDENGVLKPTGVSYDGMVKVRATSKSNSEINSEVNCMISNNKDLNTASTMSKFNLLNNENLPKYDESYKEKIVNISNNGGQYASSSIDKAIDGDRRTHWETGRPNSDSFTNEVILTMEDINEPIDRLVYATRQDGAKGKGFPLEYEIYASNIDEGNAFRKVAEGSYSGNKSDFVEIKFAPTKAKRFKFVFKNAYNGWASASEFWMYKEDKLRNTLEDLFKDSSKTELKDEYKDMGKINELEKEIQGYELQSYYEGDLSKAKELISKKPEIKGEKSLIVKLNSKFNPMDGIVGLDNEEGDITNKIVIKENTVDTSKAGVYKVIYELTDSSGRKTSMERSVIVSTEEIYLSDLNWTKATCGWRSVQKDLSVQGNNISLKGEDGQVINYEKGIGTHSNSEIVYDLKDKGYSHFISKIGVDQEMSETSPASIVFQAYLDGNKVYDSGVMRAKDEEKEIFLDLNGASELKLVVNDAGNGNAADHGSFGDARFLVMNSKPKLTIEGDKVTKLGEPIENFLGEYSAMDVEDGDLTSKVLIDGIVDFNKAGVYPITYTIVDSDGNTVSAKRKIKVVDMKNSEYLSDVDWESARNTYSSAKKDMAVSERTITLTGEDGQAVTYSKGIGTHSTSTIVYDLTKKDYGYFSSYIGVDRAMYGTVGSVTFEVWLDDKKVYDSGLMTSKMPQKYVEVNLQGAKKLKLIVTDGGNGNGSDHASFGDTKLYYVE